MSWRRVELSNDLSKTEPFHGQGHDETIVAPERPDLAPRRMSMRKLHQMTLGVATLATFGLAIGAPVEAKGIVKGAAKGAAVGHFVGHGHAKAGAMVGAVHGHHHAMKKAASN